MTNMDDCIFCKIVKGRLPGEKVYEDGEVLAFLDIKPVNIGHTLIIPKEHFKNIYETPEKVACELMRIAKKVSIAVKKELKADGVNVTMNNDSAAGQIIFHTHLHVIPRMKEDGFEMWHGRRDYREGEAKEIAEKISRAL
jgi:histidine triad (HIT) family protein